MVDSAGVRFWSIPVMLGFWLILMMSIDPLGFWALAQRSGNDRPPIFQNPVFVSWTVLLVIAQGVLLIRIRPDEERPKARRKVWPAVIAAAFCLTLLTTAILLSLAAAAGGDDSLKGVDRVAKSIDRHIPGGFADRWLPPTLFFGFMGGMWAVWWILIQKATREADPAGLAVRFLNWILVGSVLELLIAVPCHLLSRRRDDCCAPLLTFWGMATGWALLLLSLGPAVGLLIERRMARKNRRPPDRNPKTLSTNGSAN
jgi:hypothetical protein